MDSYIKAVIENDSRLGELRKAQLEGVRYRFGSGIYAVSQSKLKKNLECGKEYDLMFVSSKLNVNSIYGECYSFRTYTFCDKEELENLILRFKYNICNAEVGMGVNIYIRDGSY